MIFTATQLIPNSGIVLNLKIYSCFKTEWKAPWNKPNVPSDVRFSNSNYATKLNYIFF